MVFRSLIRANELQDLMTSSTHGVVLDCRFDLADPQAGERSFAQGHIPGAHYAHLETALSSAKHSADGIFRGRHPLPERTAFAATVGRWGITPATQVTVMDEQGGMFAARAWWMLRWLGHDNVAVLDGGLPAWQRAGGALSTTSAALNPDAAPYPERSPLVRQFNADEVLQRLGRHRIVDARASERFRGEVEPLDAAAGHIPGACNRPFKANLDEQGGFKAAEALRTEWAELLGDSAPDSVIHQCGSGVTACHNLLALEIAGLPGGVLYPGSWSEWSSDPQRPVAKG